MEYSFVIVLVTVLARVQGYYNSDLNNTATLASAHSTKNSHGYHNELVDRTRYKYQSRKQFEQSFDHYRSDRREPRFVSFQTKDDNIEVEIDFAVPFLSIPVKRSLSGAMGTLQNVFNGIPMANVNVGAVILTGIVIVGGAMIGGIGRLLNGGSFLEVYGNALPWFKTGNKRQKQDADDSSPWWTIMEEIDKALLKYDFDTTSCTQRAICWYVKESLANIEEQKASSFDHFVSTLSNSEWIQQLLTNTAWNSALAAGKQGRNCESTYASCRLSPSHLENFTNKLVQYAKRK